MAVFMVERDLKGISMEDLAGAQRAAIQQASLMRSESEAIRYLRSTFVADDGRCLCLFEADSAAVVERLNTVAGLPFHRIVPAFDLTP